MDNQHEPGYFDKHKKTFYVVMFIIIAISVSGYFMGLRQVEREQLHQNTISSSYHMEDKHQSDHHKVLPVVSYKELRPSPLKANHNWKNHLDKLPDPEMDKKNDEFNYYIKSRSIMERSKRRAYDGAPPVAPHPIDQNDSSSCIACHGKEMYIGGKIIPKMSHKFLTSCTQCHVSSKGINPRVNNSDYGLLILNLFEGKESPGEGERAYQGAPPVIPHTTLMRSECMSCHGPSRPNAIRTSHPDRQSCTQCHAPSAELELR